MDKIKEQAMRLWSLAMAHKKGTAVAVAVIVLLIILS